ncbi:MAG: flavodoxin-dependent (E)-4-hydroxy-3-methylbut-2-enyl-diphosphate synthase, partial [bacterium]|nr:flavodoxin-dependent (E)-4-hydroxy-3-methylbut-2-enyl-diphosphate synthase [bacterium]
MNRRCVKVGRIYIGGGYPISVQAMTKLFTSDVKDMIKQIKNIEKIGGEIVRVAVLNKTDARSISKIKREIEIPLVADI